jgi:hypothetical protein
MEGVPAVVLLTAEQSSTLSGHGRRDDQPELVHEAGLKQGTGKLDASVTTDVAPGLLLEVAYELRNPAIHDRRVHPRDLRLLEVATYFWAR